jgi:hypothetical protein
MMKYNMGCGSRKLPGFINVDAVAACSPDQVVDLEVTPWPWPDSCADEIRFIHSLEHMGAEPKVFLAIMSETYRIAADGCTVQIDVPHPRHDNFIGDPTHVRAITPQTLALFDYEVCTKALKLGAANTPLAHYLALDFETVHTDTVIDEPYFAQLRSGAISEADLKGLIRSSFNVVREYRFTLRVRKSARQTDKNSYEEAAGSHKPDGSAAADTTSSPKAAPRATANQIAKVTKSAAASSSAAAGPCVASSATVIARTAVGPIHAARPTSTVDFVRTE